MAKSKKTNAIRRLDQDNLSYRVYNYQVEEGKTDGLTVAAAIGKDPNHVFKTLVTVSNKKEYLVFVVPVCWELDLKKAARAAGVKRVEMIPMKNLLPITGYIHGGCSPIGMKKAFRTFIDASALKQATMVCSGGKRGVQIEVKVSDMIELMSCDTADLIPS